MAGEELDDLRPLRRAAPGTEAELRLDHAAAARAGRHRPGKRTTAAGTSARRAGRTSSRWTRTAPPRIVGTRWRARAVTSAPGCAAPRPGQPPISRRFSGPTGRAHTAPPTSSSTTPPAPRTWRRRRSWPPCAPSTASTARGPSGRGSTASSSTGRSTGRARDRCGARWAQARRSTASPAEGRDRSRRPALGRRRRRARLALARPPRGRRAPLRPRVHARRDRAHARAPARHRELAPSPRPRRAAGQRRPGGAAMSEPGRPRRAPGRARPGRARGAAAHLGGRARGVRGARAGARDTDGGCGSWSPSPCSAALVAAALVAPRPLGRRLDPRPRAGRGGARSPRSSDCRRPGGCSSSPSRARGSCRPDGSKRPLGRYEDASFSPNALFVVVTDGRRVVAVEPDGDPRWSRHEADAGLGRALGADPGLPGRLPGGRHASRRRRRRTGDGCSLEGRRPGGARVDDPVEGRTVLAYAGADGRVHVVEADSGEELWSADPGAAPEQLLWSSDARRAARRHGQATPSRLYTPSGRPAAGAPDA